MNQRAVRQERFGELVRQIPEADGNQILDHLDHADFWDAAWVRAGTGKAKAAFVRRCMEHLKDCRGDRVFASILKKDPATKRVRWVFKQLDLFNREEFRQVIQSYGRRARHYHRRVQSLIGLARERFGQQREFAY
jgi:hypothetical protein